MIRSLRALMIAVLGALLVSSRVSSGRQEGQGRSPRATSPQTATGPVAQEEIIKARLHGAPPEGPLIRVGLTTDRRRITVLGDGPYRILEAEGGKPVWKERYTEEILVTTHGAEPSTERIWRVQAAAMSSREEADALAQQLRNAAGLETSVSFSPDRGSWRVRVASASSREALMPALLTIRSLGYPDAWAADEPAPGGEAWIRLVDANYDTTATDLKHVRIEGNKGTTLAIDGKRYRGSIEIVVDAAAALRVIDVLPMEDYLRGVVPAELGPSAWPEVEALKSQAVAARTYAVRNLGRFADEGFDLCDTPRCQVFEGIGAEHSLSDRAIRETAGMVATHNGQPINALYTSTCGGHTEDGGEIFPEEAAPYLRGVPCYPEEETLKRQGSVIEGEAVADAGGPPEEVHAAALLAAAGIASRDQFPASWRKEALSEEEARRLIEAAGAALGLRGKIAPDRHASGRLGFSLALADRIWGDERPGRLLDLRDLPALLPFTDADAIPAADRPQAAAAASHGLLPAALGGSLHPEGLLTRGEALVILQRVAAMYGSPEIIEATLLRVSSRKLGFKTPSREVSLAPPGRLALFLDEGGGAVPHQRLALYPGDRIRCALSPEGEAQVLLLLPGRHGLSDDRYSPTYAWEVAMSEDELTRKLAVRFEIGNVQDIVPIRRGVSGRVVSLRIVGERGEAVISGFNVRVALGLKESLFVVERQRGSDGKLRRVVFAGKGWGHGVGMCQVGAYGMAVRGSTYQEILKHYYTGIKLARLY